MLAKSTQTAINRVAKEQNRNLKKKVDRSLRSIVQQFDLMISNKDHDPSEIPVRKAIKEFLVEANPKFELIKADLEALKQSYAA